MIKKILHAAQLDITIAEHPAKFSMLQLAGNWAGWEDNKILFANNTLTISSVPAGMS